MASEDRPPSVEGTDASRVAVLRMLVARTVADIRREAEMLEVAGGFENTVEAYLQGYGRMHRPARLLLEEVDRLLTVVEAARAVAGWRESIQADADAYGGGDECRALWAALDALDAAVNAHSPAHREEAGSDG